MSVYSRMMKGSRSLGSTPSSFELGYALGNAYGDMWASNAKKRNEAQMDEVVKQYMDDQRMQQLANPIEEKPLMTEAINGNYVSDNQNGINNNVSGIGKLNRNYGLATPQNIIDEAKRRGIHQEVIDERMKGVREQIASKAKSQYMPQINQLIYGSTDANGNYVAPTQADYLKASGLIDDYRKYDTVGADKLTETLNNRQLGQLQHLANRQQTLDDYKFATAHGMKQGKQQYRISSSDLNSANSILSDLNALEASGIKLDADQIAMRNTAKSIISAYGNERGLNNETVNTTTEPQESNAPKQSNQISLPKVKEAVVAKLKAGENKADILQATAETRGKDSAEYKALVSVFDEMEKEEKHRADVDLKNQNLKNFLSDVRALGIGSNWMGMPNPQSAVEREKMRELEAKYGVNYTDIPILGYKY